MKIVAASQRQGRLQLLRNRCRRAHRKSKGVEPFLESVLENRRTYVHCDQLSSASGRVRLELLWPKDTFGRHFYSSRSLRKLNLSGNLLTSAPKALEETTMLEVLYLDENPIQIINYLYPFPLIPKLKELSLCCMPHLTVIGPYAFPGLTSLEHLRIQNCPKLESIDDYALATKNNSEAPVWPPLKQLDLSDNALRYLPQQLVARWDWLEKLDLMNNKWSCDCNNQYLIGTLLPKYGKKLMGDELDSLTCAFPPEHAGKNLSSLSHRTCVAWT